MAVIGFHPSAGHQHEYRFRLNGFLVLYFALGIMISIRLGSVGIVRLMSSLGLTNTLWALLLVYTTGGLPLTIFIMTQFMRQIPTELKQAARIDGANEYQVFWLVLPLVQPVIATIAGFCDNSHLERSLVSTHSRPSGTRAHSHTGYAAVYRLIRD
jgi:ABC-type glycerol-3-phosphate transport system permease component